jgi:hypothetical protein
MPQIFSFACDVGDVLQLCRGVDELAHLQGFWFDILISCVSTRQTNNKAGV